MSMSAQSAGARSYGEANRERFRAELMELLRIPSISTLPEHKDDVRRAAAYVADHLRRAGLENVEVVATAGHPLVYGEWLKATGKPTVLLYGHYDVQPVDPLDLWETPPFEPTIKGDNLYARGASDDKGQMFALVKALEALHQADGAFPVNVKVLIEGEEEAGGESIEAYVKAHPERLAADLSLIYDTGMPEVGLPAVTYGLRGILYTELEVRGAKRDLHSGVYGGVAPNPLHALALILAGLKDRDGHIHIPGFYDRVRPATEAEKENWASYPFDVDAALRDEMGIPALVGEAEYGAEERRTARPTLEVHGIIGGFTGEGAKTVIPNVVKAKVSMRLVPDQRPGDIFPLFEQAVQALCPPSVEVTIRNVHGGDGVLLPLESKWMQAAASALRAVFDRDPIYLREGGSIPIGALFENVLHAPPVFMGFGLPDDNLHAPNEKFYLPHYEIAIQSAIEFLYEVGN
ncbi:MAG TPA: dipeptidase [Ktedonobacterales bacterium]|nr:dipeptidase [Ktedonobacterales bacterium]